MSSIQWTGLEELKAQLRTLPSDLTAEASGIVNGAGNSAKQEIEGAYPERTGDLRNHVSLSTQSLGQFGAGVVVKNTSKHASIFENGTQARHTAIGANRGSMPPGRVFIPIASRWRRQMYEQFKAMLVRHGLTVSGDA